VAAGAAVAAIALQVPAGSPAAAVSFGAGVLGAAARAAAFGSSARGEARACATELCAATRFAARSTVRAVGADIEAFVDLPVAVLVSVVAGLGGCLAHANAAQGLLAVFAVANTFAARGSKLAHQHARLAAACDVVDLAVAIIVAALVPARFCVGRDTLAAFASELAIDARAHACLARADA